MRYVYLSVGVRFGLQDYLHKELRSRFGEVRYVVHVDADGSVRVVNITSLREFTFTPDPEISLRHQVFDAIEVEAA